MSPLFRVAFNGGSTVLPTYICVLAVAAGRC